MKTIRPIPIEHTRGSLPMGGYIENTAIYRIEGKAADVIRFEDSSPMAERIPVMLGKQLAFVIADVLSVAECQQVIDVSERLGYTPEAAGIRTPPGMRLNQSVHWVSDDSLLGTIFSRIEHLLPATIDGNPLHKQLSHRINFYRYHKNERFNRHTDGSWPGYSLNNTGDGITQWPSQESQLSMLLYLNDATDGVEGGHTRLYNESGDSVDIIPKTGSALFFRHGFDLSSVIHEGRPVTSNVAKYVARINVMYEKNGA